MPIDYLSADQVLELSFGKLDRQAARLDFPKPGTLSNQVSSLIGGAGAGALTHQHSSMLASAGVEMWHRAIHSFLWSVVLTETSPLWSSNTGYYASHFVMRAFAHSLGIFKSFTKRAAIQVVVRNGHFICNQLNENRGEHAFYWRAVKEHPTLAPNPLFRENNEREDNKKEDQSDSLHRTFATYTDHLNSFKAVNVPPVEEVTQRLEKISHIRRCSVTAPTPQRGRFPDLDKVQILAFQRIVAFHDFLDDKVPKNRFDIRSSIKKNLCAPHAIELRTNMKRCHSFAARERAGHAQPSIKAFTRTTQESPETSVIVQ